MEAVKSTIYENIGGVGHALAPPEHSFQLGQVPNLSGKVAVVTGGSEGIGYACTTTLLAHGISRLYCLSVSDDVMSQTSKALHEEHGEERASRLKWIQCDLSDWTATAKAANEIASSTDRLDILINNAARGIMTAQKAPSNGIDLHMAINHIGHVVLTSHLLPLLKKTAEDKSNTVRIVNLASNAHQQAPSDTKFASVEELNHDYGPMAQYGRSKLAAILYSRYLARHLTSTHPNIVANATHPGIVETRQSSEHILEPYPVAGHAMTHLLNPIKKSALDGCVSTMWAATVTHKSGEYICPPVTPEQGSPQSQDVALGEQLMKLTTEVVESATKRESEARGCPFSTY